MNVCKGCIIENKKSEIKKSVDVKSISVDVIAVDNSKELHDAGLINSTFIDVDVLTNESILMKNINHADTSPGINGDSKMNNKLHYIINSEELKPNFSNINIVRGFKVMDKKNIFNWSSKSNCVHSNVFNKMHLNNSRC